MAKLFSKNSNLCDHNSPTLQTDGQTDTKVHRAVKKITVNDSVGLGNADDYGVSE